MSAELRDKTGAPVRVALARSRGLATHLDGARIMNAIVATGAEAAAVAGRFDSVTLCLSNGLGAPVGALLAGPAELVGRAQGLRKTLGGGMRQTGVLAAAGIYALENNVTHLDIDDEAIEGVRRVCKEFFGR